MPADLKLSSLLAPDPAVLHDQARELDAVADAEAAAIRALERTRGGYPLHLRAAAWLLLRRLRADELDHRRQTFRLLQRAVAGFRALCGEEMDAIRARPTLDVELLDRAILAGLFEDAE